MCLTLFPHDFTQFPNVTLLKIGDTQEVTSFGPFLRHDEKASKHLSIYLSIFTQTWCICQA